MSPRKRSAQSTFWHLLLAGCIGAAGCSSRTTTEPPNLPDRPGPAEKAEVSASDDRLLGEWVMAPPPSQKREVDLVRYALATPPNETAFAATNPTAQERESFGNIQRLRNEEPGSPLLEQLRRKIDQLDGVRVTFTPEKMITTTPGGTTIVRYSIEEDLGDQLVILEEGDADVSKRRGMIAFADANNIVITKGATRIPMARVPGGSTPPPTEAPSSPSGTTGGSATTDGSATTGGIPSSGDADFDACVAEYYRCIDAMPAEVRDGMGDALQATKRVFEAARTDPQRRKSATVSCKQAVELARATYCPTPPG